MKKKHLRRQMREYRNLVRLIHSRTCSAPEDCNYGQPAPPELADDKTLPWPERQEMARKRLEWMSHCQAAVDAQNIASHVRFGKGGRVRK